MMENMTKEGIHKIPLFLKVSDKVSEYIKPNKKTTMKSPIKKKKTIMKNKQIQIQNKKKKKHTQNKKKHTQNKRNIHKIKETYTK